MACNDPRSWIYTLLLRAVALFINIVCLVLLGIGFPRGMLIHLILVCDPPSNKETKTPN